MTVIDRVDPAATPSPRDVSLRPASAVRLRFVGHRGDYWRLMIRGGVLQAITLGIYRFWLFTDMRRFLWASTAAEGEALEYTGRAAEPLNGVRPAIRSLFPGFAGVFVASPGTGVLHVLSGLPS